MSDADEESSSLLLSVSSSSVSVTKAEEALNAEIVIKKTSDGDSQKENGIVAVTREVTESSDEVLPIIVNSCSTTGTPADIVASVPASVAVLLGEGEQRQTKLVEIEIEPETETKPTVEVLSVDKESVKQPSSTSTSPSSLLNPDPINVLRHIKNVQNQTQKESKEQWTTNDQSLIAPSSTTTSSLALVDLGDNPSGDSPRGVPAHVQDHVVSTKTKPSHESIESFRNTSFSSIDAKAKEIQIEVSQESQLCCSVLIKNNDDGEVECGNGTEKAEKVKQEQKESILIPASELDLLSGFASCAAASGGTELEVDFEDVGADTNDNNDDDDRIISEPLPMFDYSVSEFGGPWSCTTCTYLNFSNVPTCFQCNAQKIQFNFANQVHSESEPKSNSDSPLSSTVRPLKISDYQNVCLSSSPASNKTTSTTTITKTAATAATNNSGCSDPPLYLPLSSSTPANTNTKAKITCTSNSKSKSTSSPSPTRTPSSIIPIPLSAAKTATATPPITVNGSSHYYCDYDTTGTGTSNNRQETRNNFSSTISTSYDEYWIDPPINTHESDDKWACPMCTFENWPASAKCSMCLTLREVVVYNSSNIQQDSSNNNSEIIENNRVLSESMANSSYTQRLRNRKFEADARWLEACRGVVSGNIAPIEEFLARGGDPTRQLTSSEVAILNRPSAFDVGYTLVHLALRFQHQETLAMLLSHLDCSNTSSVVKRVPSYVAPDLDQDIRNHVMNTIRYGKGNFRCNFSSEIATFTLPSGIQDLSSDTQETLYDEILDRDVQKELESGQFINWSSELMVQLNSRLYALWNRSAGDCLLDSVLQATWGIFDKDNRLRQSLANSLRESASLFYQRWRENEILLSHMLDFSLDETQCATDWDNLLSVAGQPGSSLEQLHIFALAHIFRRPIIVYSVKFVKSYLGETLGYARYEGVYLPLLWDSSLCWKWPIALGYTRGHFSALVPQEPHSDPLARVASASQLDGDGISSRCTYLPLNTADGNLLPIHFLSQAEVGNEEMILSQWLDLSYTNSGILVARQRIQKRPLLVAQLVEEWLNHYRTLGQMGSTPYMRQSTATCYSSDGDSDND